MPDLQVKIVPVTAFAQNCTLVWSGETGHGVVIDPGGEIDRIAAEIDDAGFAVDAIWLTHGHIDHAAGAMEMKDRLGGVDIIGPHKDDQSLLQNLEKQAQMFGLTEKVRNVTPDRWLEEGETLSIGAHQFAVFHCPGHAPGHVVFYNETLKFAHLGDVLFAGSIGRTDLPGGDHQTLLDSIARVPMTWPDDVQFICGHGPASSIGRERASNPFLQG